MQSRRKFLKLGAGVAIGGLAAATLPMTALASACGEVDWDETVDTIVIGSGFAGLSAALNVKRKKLGTVLVLEKMQVIGGNSAVNGGWFAVPKNPIQLTQGIQDDSPEELVNDQMIAGRGMANKEILTKVANHALDAYQMCIDAGVEFRKGFNIQVGGHNKARAIRTKHGTGGDITTKLYETARREGVEFRLQYYIEDFIRVDDKIEGVVVRRGYRFPDKSTGELIRIKANKAVICASGGFARNMKLCAAVDPSLDPSLDGTNHLGATGEVILSAAATGALPIHLNMIQTGHWGSPDEGGFGWSNALLSIGWHEGMSVSVLSGKRYMDERADRLTCSAAIMSNRYPDGSPAYPLVFFNYNDHPEDDRVVRALRDKMAWKMDSLEQMAEKFDVPPAALQQTVEEYNQHVEKRTDPDFGRKMDTAKVLKAPFVVSRIWPKVHYCMGGLKTDADARVLDARTMEPIKNFYATGEVTGGVHGEARLSSCSCLETLAMGFVVSQTIKADA